MLSALRTAIDNLVKAVTSGAGQVPSSATAVVNNGVNLLTSTLLGSGLPTSGAPVLPSLPAVPSLPPTG